MVFTSQNETNKQQRQLELSLDDTQRYHVLSPNRKSSFDPKTIQELYEVLQQGSKLIV